jgi:hypothetical protein
MMSALYFSGDFSWLSLVFIGLLAPIFNGFAYEKRRLSFCNAWG